MDSNPPTTADYVMSMAEDNKRKLEEIERHLKLAETKARTASESNLPNLQKKVILAAVKVRDARKAVQQLGAVNLNFHPAYVHALSAALKEFDVVVDAYLNIGWWYYSGGQGGYNEEEKRTMVQ